MKIALIGLEGQALEAWQNWTSCKDQETFENLVNDPKYHYDPLEFFSLYRDKDMRGFYVRVIGDPTNIKEALIARLYGDNPTYEHMSQAFPEDFVESRTSYEDLLDYANDMSSFIGELINMI